MLPLFILFFQLLILDMPKSLILKNDISEIRRLHRSVIQFAEQNRLRKDLIADIRLVMEEVFSNIVQYGFEDEDRHHIAVDMEYRGGELILSVVDDGKPFNPLQAPPPEIDKPLEDRCPGGMGIFMVTRLMDQLEYRMEEGKNILKMKKPAPPEAP